MWELVSESLDNRESLANRLGRLAARIFGWLPWQTTFYAISRLANEGAALSVLDVAVGVCGRLLGSAATLTGSPQGRRNTLPLFEFAAGDYRRCGDRTGKAPQSAIGRALCQAGEAWLVWGPEAGALGDADQVLVVLLPGADARAVAPLVRPEQSLQVVCYQGSRGTEQLAECRQQVERFRFLPSLLTGFNVPWHDQLRLVAETVLGRMVEEFGEHQIGAIVRQHHLMLANRLNIELLNHLSPIEALVKVVGERQARTILVVEGNTDADYVVSALGAAGSAELRIFTTSGASLPSKRIGFLRRRLAPAPDPVVDAASSLDQVVNDLRRRIRVPDLENKIVVGADLRNPREFRYSPTAWPLLRRLASQHAVSLIQQRNLYSYQLVRVWAKLLFYCGGDVRLASLPSHHALRRSKHRPLPEALSLQLARRSLHELDIALPAAYVQPVLVEAVRRFISGYLVEGAALASRVEEGCRGKPPRAAVFIPDSQPFLMAVASGMRCAGIPTLTVQTLLIGHSSRDCHPVSEWIACIDDVQGALYNYRFGTPQDRIIAIGHVDLGQELDVRREKRPQSSSRKAVNFITQPVPALVGPALRWTISAVAAWADCELRVFLHPNEAEVVREQYIRIVREANLPDRIRVIVKRDGPDDMYAADAIVNIASNIGYKAGVRGHRVLVIDPSSTGLPLGFHDLGIAILASDRDSTSAKLRGLIDGCFDAELYNSRREFLGRNLALVRGTSTEQLAELVMNMPHRKSTIGRATQ